MRLTCLALTWSCGLALAGEGDAAAAQMRVAAKGKTIRCIRCSPSLRSRAAKTKGRQDLRLNDLGVTAHLQVDYDSCMGETRRKLAGNWTSP
jgi:hypothetical protein